MARFGSVVTAMVTAFDESGAVDIDTTVRLARWLVEQGNDGLVVTGTTGEAPVLNDDEKRDVWRAVSEAVAVPVVAGAGTNDTRHSIELAKLAADAGADAILAVTPYYNRPSQAGLAAHFRAVAEAVSLPVMIYDIPVRTGRKVAHDTLLELLQGVPNIVAVKDAAGDPAASARLIAEAPSHFELYSGDDSLTLPLLAVGAVGVVGVATHWSAPLHVEMVTAFQKGDVARAREINARLQASFRFETGDAAPNPVPAKAMMRVLGFPVGQCRLPMGPEPDGIEQQARDVLAALEQSDTERG